MKRIVKISIIICGAVIGAGIASGKEIISNFAIYSLGGLLGTIVVLIAGTLSIYAILRYCFQARIYKYSELLKNIFPKTNRLISAIVTVFLFSVYIVMADGSGSLLHEEAGWNKNFGIILLIVMSFCVLLYDFCGLMKFNIILSPILLFGIIAVSLCEIVCISTPAFFSFAKKTVFNPFSSALIYLSYNMLLAMAVLIPLSKFLKDKKEARYSAFLCGLILFITILTVYFAMYFAYIKVLPFELPLLSLASGMGKDIEYFYCILMMFAMLTSAVAAGYGFAKIISDAFKISRKPSLMIMCLSAYPFAALGFANLIHSFYILFGIFGLFILIGIVYRSIRRSS